MENTKEINILLVGLGPHAKRIYFPILQREGSDFNSRISLIGDLVENH
jgi:hypothetical protein